MTDTGRWLLIVAIALLVIALVAFARGDETERSVEALALGMSSMIGSKEASS